MENINGKDVSVTVFVDGNPKKNFKAKNFTWKANKTEITDPVLGEDRDDLDSITNSYSLSMSLYLVNVDFVDAMISEQANQDANGVSTEKAVSIRIKTRDGGKFGLIFSGQMTIDAWDCSVGGRGERGMANMPMRCKYMDKVIL